MRRFPIRRLLAPLVLAVLASGTARAGDGIEIDRTISVQPKYEGQPGYALLLFGPQASFRVWLVWDRTAGKLYVDRNGNGDLTEEGEAVQGVLGREPLLVSFDPDASMETQTFSVGSIQEPGGSFVHRDIAIKTSIGVRMSLRLNGESRFALGRFWFQPTPEKAAVFQLRKSLTFQWIGPEALRAGEVVDLQTHLGSRAPGSGFARIFCDAVPSHLHPVAELRFPHGDSDEAPIIVRAVLNRRC